jgi:hypothetical protein
MVDSFVGVSAMARTIDHMIGTPEKWGSRYAAAIEPPN